MYDRQKSGEVFSKYVGVSLAWWHSYKWATKKIMQAFGPDFIGPLFHHIFPLKKFAPKKSKLSSNATVLSWIRLAYPSFRSALEEALSLPGIFPRAKRLLTNMQDLCQYFIPVVCFLFVLFVLKCLYFIKKPPKRN